MIRFLRKFWRREEGYATAEVALLFPAMIWPFMMAMETSFIQIRHSMVERAMDIVVRDLRLGDPVLDDPNALIEAMCAEILVMPDCSKDMMLEMGPVQVADFEYEEGVVECVDRREDVNPVLQYQPGAVNEMMILRFCVLHDPIFPAVGLGRVMPRQAGGGYPLIATTFFVNEPT